MAGIYTKSSRTDAIGERGGMEVQISDKRGGNGEIKHQMFKEKEEIKKQ